MKFEVIGSDGKVKMSTEHKRCIPSATALKQIEKAGYRFRVDGKRWRFGQEVGKTIK